MGREDFLFAESTQGAEGRAGRAADGEAEEGEGRGPDRLSRPNSQPDPAPARKAAPRRRRAPGAKDNAPPARRATGGCTGAAVRPRRPGGLTSGQYGPNAPPQA